MILPDTGRDDALALALRLQNRVAAVSANGLGLPLSASIGVAEWNRGETASATLTLADRALRAAKTAGGEAVVVIGEIT